MLEDKKQEQIAGIISDFCDGTIAEADIDIIAMRIYKNVFKDTKWQNLKEYLKEYTLTIIPIKTVLDKMQELEGENE